MARAKKKATRIRRSREEVEEILGIYERCDLTRADFSDEHGIPLGTLANWLRQRANRRAESTHFVEVAATESTGVGETAVGQGSVADPVRDADFEIVFAQTENSGVRSLRIQGGFHSRDLNRVLEAISELRQKVSTELK